MTVADVASPTRSCSNKRTPRWVSIPPSTWFVADAGRDIEAARRFGCRPALLRTGKGRATEADYPDVPTWDTLDAFAEWLTNRGVQPEVL